MVMVDICNNLILYTMYCLFCDMFCSLMYASSGLINKEFEFELLQSLNWDEHTPIADQVINNSSGDQRRGFYQ